MIRVALIAFVFALAPSFTAQGDGVRDLLQEVRAGWNCNAYICTFAGLPGFVKVDRRFER